MSRTSEAFDMLDRASPMPPKLRKAAPKPGPWRDEGYRRLVAMLPCARCDKENISQAAHVGGLALGMGRGIKPPDWAIIPLCADQPGRRGCHSRRDQGPGLPGFSEVAAIGDTLVWALQAKKIKVEVKR